MRFTAHEIFLVIYSGVCTLLDIEASGFYGYMLAPPHSWAQGNSFASGTVSLYLRMGKCR